MLPAAVVGVTTVGVAGSAVRSANATIPFLARFTGQGLESGDARPSIIRFRVAVPKPHPFVALSVTVNVPGLVGVPETVPVLGSIDKPWGRKFADKVPGWFVPGVKENGTPVGIVRGS